MHLMRVNTQKENLTTITMKTTLIIAAALIVSVIAKAQPNFGQINLPVGYQFAGITLESTLPGQEFIATGKTRNIMFGGEAMTERAIVAFDASYLVRSLFRGLKTPKGDHEGGIFDVSLGLPFAKKENSMWGATADITFRNITVDATKQDSTTSMGLIPYGYLGVGASVHYLRSFGKLIYVRPRFGIAYGGLTQNGNSRGTKTDVAVSIGITPFDRLGLAITFGAYGIKTPEININAKYTRVGICYAFKSGN